jgi:hypothetical protein
MTTQSDGSDEKSILNSDHAQPPDEYSEIAKKRSAGVENIRERTRRFLEKRRNGCENETSVVFNNISVEGSGTGVSIQTTLEIN